MKEIAVLETWTSGNIGVRWAFRLVTDETGRIWVQFQALGLDLKKFKRLPDGVWRDDEGMETVPDEHFNDLVPVFA